MASIEKRGNSYRIKVSCGYKVDGKQVTQRMTWTPDPDMTPKQIEKELQRQVVLFEEECKNKPVVATIKFEALAEEWFEEYAKLNLKSTTFTRQRQLTKRVYKAIGHLRLDKITARDIQKFINSLAQEGVNEHTGKPLSRKTMVHYLSFISTILDYAIRMDMLNDNPCRRVTIPKGSKKKRHILTMEETQHFFKLLDDHAPLKWKAFFVLIIYSGMRRGEMLGLEWHDIDFSTGMIHIERTSNYTKARGIYTDTPKTENSVRYIKVPMNVIDVLKEYKEWQDAERERIGSKWVETNRLFTKWCGTPMNLQTPYGWLQEFCEEHDFPFYGIHQFRHLHTSLLIGAGIDPTTVSGVLGHAQVSTTLNLYSHMFRENQVRACDAVANALSFVQPTNPTPTPPPVSNTANCKEDYDNPPRITWSRTGYGA
ncbi:tyrosine-type recombinase/integrase [Ruminococcus albus]|uniref:Site-specific recombinase XerD n=1 Tax=Ruminococcus albus TaxID=1264 RepID=A0A1H7Q5N8_RUMAL|nr:site-specific integrase [Ruminococcus albus]SEL42805.1 Site-specific recombinase XerD [Ruminococcus albus]